MRALRHLLLLLVGVLALRVSYGSQSFQAHRMLQYDRGTTSLGSRRVTVNYLASSVQAPELSRKVAVLRMKDIRNGTIEELVTKKQAGGILVLIPTKLEDIPDETIQDWRRYEQVLMQQEVIVPVYFAYETPELSALHDEVWQVTADGKTAGAASSEGYQVVVGGAEASKVGRIELTNIQALLEGSGGVNAEGKPLPIIAIVAYYDSLGIAPDLANGTDSNASGVVALLELARLYSKLYSGPRTNGKYNLLFLLTAGGRLNYVGSREWLAAADQRLLERIEVVLCLDSIGRVPPESKTNPSASALYLHVQKPSKDMESAKQTLKLYNALMRSGKEAGVVVEMVARKMNKSDPHRLWEHEVYLFKRLFAATLSAYPSGMPMFGRASIFDQRELVDPNVVARNVHVIAEAIAKYVYNLHGQKTEVFAGSLRPNGHFISAWLDALSRLPRAAPYSPRNGPVVQALEKVVREYCHDEVTKQVVTPDSEYSFYDKATAKMTVYRVKPFMFHLIVLFCVLLYLLILYVVLSGPRQFLPLLTGLGFTAPSPRTDKRKQT